MNRLRLKQRLYLSGKQYCGNQVALAVRRGLLPKAATLQCADCKGRATEYDHRDYNKPLEVEPVCRKCNARRGKAIWRNWSFDEFAQRHGKYLGREAHTVYHTQLPAVRRAAA